MFDVLIIYQESAGVPMIIETEHVKKIEENIDGRVFWCKSEDEALEKGYDAEVLFIWGGSGKMPVEYCRRSKKIKWINSFSAGVNPIVESEIAMLPIKLTNSKGIHGKTMGLTALGYMIAFLRQFPEFQRRQNKHVWNKNTITPLQEAEGKTVTIVGAGAIGSEVARLSKMCGMHVIGVKRNVTVLNNYDEVVATAELKTALSKADFVVVLTPLTENTKHLIGKEELMSMKNTGILINISRGPVVDTKALVEALESGCIGGAALDALDPEPLNSDSPLWDMPNVIITPHCSADSEKYMDRAIDLFCENLKRYEKNETLINEIDMTKKY